LLGYNNNCALARLYGPSRCRAGTGRDLRSETDLPPKGDFLSRVGNAVGPAGYQRVLLFIHWVQPSQAAEKHLAGTRLLMNISRFFLKAARKAISPEFGAVGGPTALPLRQTAKIEQIPKAAFFAPTSPYPIAWR
jgi:hypothetical protein